MTFSYRCTIHYLAIHFNRRDMRNDALAELTGRSNALAKLTNNNSSSHSAATVRLPCFGDRNEVSEMTQFHGLFLLVMPIRHGYQLIKHFSNALWTPKLLTSAQ